MPESATFDDVPTMVPKNTEYKKWRGSEMYAKNGIEMKKVGEYVGTWIDEKNWERKLWRAPNQHTETAEDADPVMKEGEDKNKDARKDRHAVVDLDA